MTPKAVRDFILWMRRERIGCAALTIGNVTIDGFVDGKASAPQKHAGVEPRRTMYEIYGEELLKQPVAPMDDVPDEAKTDD